MAQPTPDIFASVEAMFRCIGKTATIAVQPSGDFITGELWTIHTHCGGSYGMGRGGTLQAACADFHAVPARPALQAA